MITKFIKIPFPKAAVFTAFILSIILFMPGLSSICRAEELKPAELYFEPVGGGKFIYCNNTEGIFREYLADSSNPNPRYTMSNLDLTPDRYYIYLSHINYTYGYDESYNPYGLGFDVELDLEITAKEDSVLRINRAAFETPKVKRYLDDGGNMKYVFPTWGAENAVATMADHDIYMLNSDVVFKNSGYSPKTVSIKKGETVWLSEFIDNYSACAMILPVFMTADTELLSGKVDMNVAELRSKDGKIGDRSDFNRDNVAFGSYLRDRCLKGVADSLPEVETELEYEIDDTTADGEYLPVKFKNQYTEDEVVLNSWVTNLNPQDDIWAKYTTAESDMLAFKYYDPSKLEFYGSNVPKDRQSDTWIFDTRHSDTREYVSESGFSKENYIPNYELSPEKDNQGFGCSMGNYGVTTRYNLKITNNGEKTRYFNYDASTAADIIVTMKNKDGSLWRGQEHPIIAKGGHGTNIVTDTCAYAELPPHSTTEFTLETLLPVNYLGGVTNAFRISDAKPNMTFLTSYRTMLPDYDTIYNKYFDEYSQKADDATKELLSGNLDNFEVTKTNRGYMLRFKAWDANPNFQGNFKTVGSDIYFLDNNFCYTGKSHFDEFPLKAVESDGKCTVTLQSGKRLFSADEKTWHEPLWPADTDESLDKILVSLNGEFLEFDVDPILVSDRTLVPMRKIFEALKLSVNWNDFTQTATAYDENRAISFTLGSNIAAVNGKDFTIDVAPELCRDRTMIPLRFLSETLGYRVSWDDVSRCAYIDDYPKLPDSVPKYYVIYREGYRDDRVEAVMFDTNVSDPRLIWDGAATIEGDNSQVLNDKKYYLDEETNSWVFFEENFGTISNNASIIIKANLPTDIPR